MNNLIIKQNTESQLRILAAQRFLYSYAKRIYGTQLILTVPVVVLFSFITIFLPAFKIVSGLWGIIFVFADLFFLNDYIKKIRIKAATFQELFDCETLDINWQNIKVGSIPSSDEIYEFAKKYKKIEKNYDKLKNWYPTILEKLPLSGAQLICQYLNCWWDLVLRKKYSIVIIITLISFVTVILAIGLFNGVTLYGFILSFLLPIMPAIALGLRQIKENESFILQADKVKKYAYTFWTQFLNNTIDSDTHGQMVRELQDEIFARRCQNPLIFDFIYWCLQKDQEREMNEIAEEMVNEYNSKIA